MNPSDPSYKAIFLGPHSENEHWVRKEINSILDFWFKGRRDLFSEDVSPISKNDRQSKSFQRQQKALSSMLEHLNSLLMSETPKYTPRYMGHMVSELSLPAILGHFATLLNNPNNTAKDTSRVGAVVEEEGIEMLAEMIGYSPQLCKGHFTSGGTVANFEAVWRARYRYDHWMCLGLCLAEEFGERKNPFEIGHLGWEKYDQLVKKFEVSGDQLKKYSAVLDNPFRVYRLISKHIEKDYLGPVVLIPGNKHFSWQKAVNIFGLGEEAFWTIPLNAQGKIDIAGFGELFNKAKSDHRPVLLTVSVAGTTEAGEVDSVDDLQDFLNHLKLKENLHVWHHVDAAYGGFFCSLLGKNIEPFSSSKLKKSLEAISQSDSVTLDPHKMGYVPYSCGAFLCRNEINYSVSSFLAPYLNRPELGNGKWASTIEGSRTAAGAAATWLTGKSVGYTSETFASVIYNTIETCQNVKKEFQEKFDWIRILEPTDTNILCFSVAKEGEALSRSNEVTQALFLKLSECPEFSVSKTSLGIESYGKQIEAHVQGYGGTLNSDHLVLVRCVFMNPFWGERGVRNTLLPELEEKLRQEVKILQQN